PAPPTPAPASVAPAPVAPASVAPASVTPAPNARAVKRCIRDGAIGIDRSVIVGRGVPVTSAPPIPISVAIPANRCAGGISAERGNPSDESDHHEPTHRISPLRSYRTADYALGTGS